MEKAIDTHSHLYADQFRKDQAEVNARAKEVLEAVFLPNIDLGSIEAMETLAASDPGFFYPMMGLHPCSVDANYESVLDQMRQMFEQNTYYGVGETGVDLYWDQTFKAQQIEALKVQIEWAKAFRLPLILHSRNALDITIELIESHVDDHLTGIFHCFDGNETQAQRIAAIPGFKMGIGGIVTYKKSKLPEILQHVSPTDLVLETDSPYLPPVPYRGKRNESSYTPLVARKLAEIYVIPEAQLIETTNQNARELFRKAFLSLA